MKLIHLPITALCGVIFSFGSLAQATPPLFEQKLADAAAAGPIDAAYAISNFHVGPNIFYLIGHNASASVAPDTSGGNVYQIVSQDNGFCDTWLRIPDVTLAVGDTVTFTISFQYSAKPQEFRLGIYHLADLAKGPGDTDQGMWAQLPCETVNKASILQVEATGKYGGFLSGATTATLTHSPFNLPSVDFSGAPATISFSITRKADDSTGPAFTTGYDLNGTTASHDFAGQAAFTTTFNTLAFQGKNGGTLQVKSVEATLKHGTAAP